MAPPKNGNEYLPFRDMIALEKIDDTTFRSIALPFAPGDAGRAYGGHVYAQAAWAAAHTVPKGYTIHNITGYFILAGLVTVPFIYRVGLLRDGKSYCTRQVTVTQASDAGVCFTCTCSFKRHEDSPLDIQERIDLSETYASVLRPGTTETSWPEAPGIDVPSYVAKYYVNGRNDPFPGLDARKVDMTPYNEGRDAFSKRQLVFYRVLGALSAAREDDDPNLHACAHLYASDRNSLFVVANHAGVGETFTQMGSLSHTVVFHAPDSKDLLMEDTDGKRIWFTKEDWTTRAAGGRGIHQSRMIGPGNVHIATSWQEGMVRQGKGDSGVAARLAARSTHKL